MFNYFTIKEYEVRPFICYTLYTPIVYNAGTQWESKEDTFCHGYAPADKNQQDSIIEKLNNEATDRVYFITYQLDKN